MLSTDQTKLRFVDVSSDLLAQGYGVRFRAAGGSMAPAIGDGDVITVKPVASASLTQGRVIVYRDRDRLFAHRIVRVADDDVSRPHFVVRGDAVRDCDPPVAASQILGEVVLISPGGLRPPEPPYTLTRSPLRRLVSTSAKLQWPRRRLGEGGRFAWLARCRSLASVSR